MAVETENEPKETLRKLLPYTSVAVIIAALYCAWVFYSRWSENRDFEQKQAAQRAAENQKTVEAYGGGELNILQFYASPGAIPRGDTAQLCYGVANAKTVRIEPEVSGVWPSLSRCVDVSPKKDTTYKFIAEDAAGHTETKTVTLRVE